MPPDQGRLTKFGAYYARTTLLPTKCSNCVWFQKPNACAIVTSDGEPDPGIIEPGGTCILWNAGPVRVEVQRVLRGDEGSDGLLPGNVRVRVEEVVVASPRTVPPSRVRAGLVLPFPAPWARG